MPPLRRHQLAFLSAAGWQEVLGHAWQGEVRLCIEHWAAQCLPLVVTRQRLPRLPADAPISFGLCAPECWGRRLVSLQLPPSCVAWFSEFPLLQQVVLQLPRQARSPLLALAADLADASVPVRAYGSVGWQTVSGLAYLHKCSDIDLWLAVDDADQADAAVDALLRWTGTHMQLDGELMFPDGSAVAWREWAAWRAGRCRSLLVKTLSDCTIEPGVGRFARMAVSCAA